MFDYNSCQNEISRGRLRLNFCERAFVGNSIGGQCLTGGNAEHRVTQKVYRPLALFIGRELVEWQICPPTKKK